MRKNNKFQEVWELLNKTDNSWRIGSLSTVHDILGQIWDVNFEDLMETRESEHSRDVLERIRVCEKSSLIILNLVFFFKWPRFPVQMSEWCYRSQCSWFCFLFHLAGGALHRSFCPVRTSPIVSTTFFVCFSLSMNVFAVCCIFDFEGIFIVVLVLYESYSIKLLKK